MIRTISNIIKLIFRHLCFIQISMSALLIRVPVTRTLIAPILTVLIAVLVNRGLLGMEQFVKVSKTYGHKKHIMHVSLLFCHCHILISLVDGRVNH